MRREHLPRLIGLAVLAVGLVVGLALAAVPLSAVLGGLAVLAGSMTLLFALTRRDGADDLDDIAAPPAEPNSAVTTAETGTNDSRGRPQRQRAERGS
jgi:hypothetical protein